MKAFQSFYIKDPVSNFPNCGVQAELAQAHLVHVIEHQDFDVVIMFIIHFESEIRGNYSVKRITVYHGGKPPKGFQKINEFN